MSIAKFNATVNCYTCSYYAANTSCTISTTTTNAAILPNDGATFVSCSNLEPCKTDNDLRANNIPFQNANPESDRFRKSSHTKPASNITN